MMCSSTLNTLWREDLRKSQSIIIVFSPYCAKVTARFTDIIVLHSEGPAEVIRIDFSWSLGAEKAIFDLILFIASVAGALGCVKTNMLLPPLLLITSLFFSLFR